MLVGSLYGNAGSLWGYFLVTEYVYPSTQGSILKGVVNKSLELTEVLDFECRARLKLLFSYWLNKTKEDTILVYRRGTNGV